MADISRSILQSISRVIALVEKHDLQLNQKQCTCLAICLGQVKDCLFSRPIRIYRKLLERIRCTVNKVENFVLKCSAKNWLVNALSVGASEEESKDLILELRWCLDAQFNFLHGPLASYEAEWDECPRQWTSPQMVLPSEEDIFQDRQCLVAKLDKFLSTTGLGHEQRSLAMYVQGRLEILVGEGICKPSLGQLLQDLKVPEPSKCERLGLLLEQLLWDLKLPEPSECKHLGRGSQTFVFKTSWLGIPSAMKSLPPCNDTFLREAGTLAMLNHPNIVKLYCCYEDRTHQSLVMELMDGSLYDHLNKQRTSRKGSPFELEEVVEILLQIVKGMLYLHRNGIAHRDLKCANILVTNTKGSQTRSIGDLIVKVADFDLVKLFDPANSKPITATHFVGTTVWRAPELLINDESKIKPRRADIYSFGMVCFEVFVGEKPFDGFNSIKELTKKIIDGHRPALPEDCPLQLKVLIENCWDANCDLRPSFDEIYDCLLDMRSSLILGTNIVITQNVHTTEEHAMTRTVMTPVIHIGKFLLSFFTNNKEVYMQRSNILEQSMELLSSEDHARALHELDELDRAIDQAPNDIGALDLRAEIRCKLQDFKGSLADLDKMDVLQPNHGGTLKRRGQVKHMLDDYRGALKDLDAAMKFAFDDSCLLIQRSQTKKMLEDFEGALEDLNAADNLDVGVPRNALILGLRGEVKKKLGDFDGALKDLNEVNIKLCPHDVSILNEISQVKEMMQHRDKKKGKEVKFDEDSEMDGTRHRCRQFPCPICMTGR